jgi:hypothetical protein
VVVTQQQEVAAPDSALEILLTEEGEFIRDILLEELAKVRSGYPFRIRSVSS